MAKESYLATAARQHARAVEIITEALTQRSVGLPEIVAEPVARSILLRLANNGLFLATEDEL